MSSSNCQRLLTKIFFKFVKCLKNGFHYVLEACFMYLVHSSHSQIGGCNGVLQGDINDQVKCSTFTFTRSLWCQTTPDLEVVSALEPWCAGHPGYSLVPICHYRNVRGLGKRMVVFRLFEKLRYSNERSTIF